jgi:hypothetical protein
VKPSPSSTLSPTPLMLGLKVVSRNKAQRPVVCCGSQ